MGANTFRNDRRARAALARFSSALAIRGDEGVYVSRVLDHGGSTEGVQERTSERERLESRLSFIVVIIPFLDVVNMDGLTSRFGHISRVWLQEQTPVD